MSNEARTVLDDPCLLCGKPVTIAEALAVELNRDDEGKLHAFQDHINHAVRVGGVAHRDCYKDWYEETYKSPFIMAGDG
jgi:hypothetical protein